MRVLSYRYSALAAAMLFLPRAGAEEAPAQEELKELRQAVQQQSKQIELLTEQVGRLTRVIEGQKGAGVSAPATSIESPKTAPASLPVPENEPLPNVTKADAVPKAEAVADGAGKHVVAKGETLTSIAKQYNIPIAELKKANKIQDERKLQIGQILTVPTAKAPDSTDKKENP